MSALPNATSSQTKRVSFAAELAELDEARTKAARTATAAAGAVLNQQRCVSPPLVFPFDLGAEEKGEEFVIRRAKAPPNAPRKSDVKKVDIQGQVFETKKVQFNGEEKEVVILKRLGRGNFSEVYHCKVAGVSDDLAMSFFGYGERQLTKLGTQLYFKNKIFNNNAIQADQILSKYYAPILSSSYPETPVFFTKYQLFPLSEELTSTQVAQLVEIIEAHVKADIPMDLKRANLYCDSQGNLVVIDVYELETSLKADTSADADFKKNLRSIAKDSEQYDQLLEVYLKARNS